MAKVRTPAGHKGTDEHIIVQDGGYWARLTTRQALDCEGEAMNHCVGDGAYDCLTGSECMTDDAIWSLRTVDDLSELTIEIRDLRIVSAKGYNNHVPGKWACMQVAHLVRAFDKAGAVLSIAPAVEIVAAPDGRTFRIDRVPADVQAALAEAERRERERLLAAEADRPLVQMPHRGEGNRLVPMPPLTASAAALASKLEFLGIPVTVGRDAAAPAPEPAGGDEIPDDLFADALEYLLDFPSIAPAA